MLHIQSQTRAPDIIAIQEAGTEVKLPGYKGLQGFKLFSTAILVHRNLTAELIQLNELEIPHDLVRIFPRRKADPSYFILNISPARELIIPDSVLFLQQLKGKQTAIQ